MKFRFGLYGPDEECFMSGVCEAIDRLTAMIKIDEDIRDIAGETGDCLLDNPDVDLRVSAY